jgi:hypothetical protein
MADNDSNRDDADHDSEVEGFIKQEPDYRIIIFTNITGRNEKMLESLFDMAAPNCRSHLTFICTEYWHSYLRIRVQVKVDEQEEFKIVIKLKVRSISELHHQAVATGYAAIGEFDTNVIKAKEIEDEVFLLRIMAIPGRPYRF